VEDVTRHTNGTSLDGVNLRKLFNLLCSISMG